MAKTRKLSKVFAGILSVSLLASLLSVSAFAATGDITAITIKGETVTFTQSTTIADAKKATVELALSPADLADTTTAIAVTEEGGGTFVAQLVAGGDDSAYDAADDIVAGAEPAAQALTPGDIIWVKSSTGNLVRILINQANGGTIPGDSATKNPIYNVQVPMSTDFTIDPLQLNAITGDSQVSSVDYRITNKSNAPVMVSFDITATLASGVTMVDDVADLDQTTLTGVSKEVYLAALGAKGFLSTDVNVPTYADPKLGTYEYDEEEPGVLVPFDATDKNAEFSFLLDAVAAGPALAANNTGVASFQFYAELNTYAKWVPGDITVSGVYTITGIKTGDYTTNSADLIGVNQMASASAAPFEFVNIDGSIYAVNRDGSLYRGWGRDEDGVQFRCDPVTGIMETGYLAKSTTEYTNAGGTGYEKDIVRDPRTGERLMNCTVYFSTPLIPSYDLSILYKVATIREDYIQLAELSWPYGPPPDAYYI